MRPAALKFGIVAIYHLCAKPISRATGRSATGAAAYRAGETITDERTGLVFDYGKKRGIDHTEIMAPAHAPAWAHDRAKLWNAVEHAEKRKDSQVAREVEVALPTELNPDQQRELVREFARSQFVDAGMVADIAIHHAKGENPHAHILLTMRDIGPEGFGPKNRSWNDQALLQNWREAWAVQTNQALERAGHRVRIDHRTLAEQGVERIPQIHIGPKVPEMERRGIRTEIGGQALAIETQNEAIAALQSELEAVRHERHHETPAGPERGADRGRAGTRSLATLADQAQASIQNMEAAALQQAREWNSQQLSAANAVEAAAKTVAQHVNALQQATASLRQTAGEVQRAHRNQLWTLATVAGVSAILAAALSIGLWLWLAPAPEVQNQLDPKAVAEYLKPAILDALKRR